MNYLCVGNTACDILARVGRSQKKSGKRLFLESIDCFPGGDALNNAVDASIMGESVKFIGCAGQDMFGEAIIKKLSEYRIDLSDMRIDPRIPTSVSYYIVDEGGEKRPASQGGCCYRPGGNEALTEQDVPDSALKWADHLHLGSPMIQDGLDGGGNCTLLKRAKDHGVTTSMDLVYDQDQVWLPKIEAALHYCDIFIPSDYEVEHVCGCSDVKEMKEFFRPYGMSVFGVKMGSRGVFLTDYQKDIFVPSAYQDVPVETLGAGDAFFAAFNVSYNRGFSLERCASIASCASACVLGAFGASTGMAEYHELLKMAEDFEKSLQLSEVKLC